MNESRLSKLGIQWEVGSWVRVFDSFFGECERYQVMAYDPSDGYYTLQTPTAMVWRKGTDIYADDAPMLTRQEVEDLRQERDAAVAVIREVDALSVLSSTVQFMYHAQELTGRYLHPEVPVHEKNARPSAEAEGA